jgi:DNA-binding transcriptional regulator YbjK
MLRELLQARLPILSTYMGHVSIASTHYYLSFVEEIRSEASERFHQHFGRRIFDRMADVEECPGRLNGGGK